MRAWLLSVVLLPCLSYAQSPAAPYPLTNLTVRGNKRFTPSQIADAAGLTIGKPVNKDLFDAARARLLDSGAFESVGYEFKPNAAKTGYDATFDVAEVALLYPYRFEDLPAPEATLRAALAQQSALLHDLIPATREVLDRYQYVLAKVLDGRVPVEGKLSYDLPGEPTILFRPAGDRPHISAVHFTGTEWVPAPRLLNTSADVAVGTEFPEPAVRRL